MCNSTDGSVSPKPRWCKGLPPTFVVEFDGDNDNTSGVDSREHKPQQQQQHEESTTPKTAASTSDDDDEGAPSPPSLRPGGTRDVSSSSSRTSSRSGKAYMAWSWLIEDEAATEPNLQKPDQGSPAVPPPLLDAERELLCRNVELRLLEVRREVAGWQG